MKKEERKTMRLLVCLAAFLAVVASACGRENVETSRSPVTSELVPPTSENLHEFIDYVRVIESDYEPSATPAALARVVDAVVAGEIEGVSAGQSYAPVAGEEPAIATSVLKVRVDRTFKGGGRAVHEGFVYLEVAHPAFVGTGVEDGKEVPYDREAFAASVPRADGIFFLDDRTNEPYWPTVINQGSGRPTDARLFAPYIQGFLIEDESGRLVSVMDPLGLMPPAWHGLRSVEEVVRASEF